MRIRRYEAMAALSLAAGLICGCTGGVAASTGPIHRAATGGNAQRGEHIIAQRGCGTCHTIPGIDGANGVFGPPLNDFARRSMIAGNFANTSKNLVSWIMDPQAMKPGTAMPDLGLTKQQAQDAAAYLYTLR